MITPTTHPALQMFKETLKRTIQQAQENDMHSKLAAELRKSELERDVRMLEVCAPYAPYPPFRSLVAKSAHEDCTVLDFVGRIHQERVREAWRHCLSSYLFWATLPLPVRIRIITHLTDDFTPLQLEREMRLARIKEEEMRQGVLDFMADEVCIVCARLGGACGCEHARIGGPCVPPTHPVTCEEMLADTHTAVQEGWLSLPLLLQERRLLVDVVPMLMRALDRLSSQQRERARRANEDAEIQELTNQRLEMVREQAAERKKRLDRERRKQLLELEIRRERLRGMWTCNRDRESRSPSLLSRQQAGVATENLFGFDALVLITRSGRSCTVLLARHLPHEAM